MESLREEYDWLADELESVDVDDGDFNPEEDEGDGGGVAADVREKKTPFFNGIIYEIVGFFFFSSLRHC